MAAANPQQGGFLTLLKKRNFLRLWLAQLISMTILNAMGRIAFDERAATFPGVSWPSSVVRSIIRTARSRANTFASRLIDRLASEAARSSSATASTDPIRGSRGSSGSSKPRGRTGACDMK